MSKTTRALCLSALALVLTLAAGACTPAEPVQHVSFNDRLEMDIAQTWVKQRESSGKLFYRLGDAKDIRLSFEDQTRDWGAPMNVQGVRSAIGSELNLAYGNVNARTSFTGNAILDYPRAIKEGRKKIHTRNWVVAKPFGHSAVARIVITLRVPDGQEGSAEVQSVIASLDKQVGDAKIPEA
jgi:hypothetical protein